MRISTISLAPPGFLLVGVRALNVNGSVTPRYANVRNSDEDYLEIISNYCWAWEKYRQYTHIKSAILLRPKLVSKPPTKLQNPSTQVRSMDDPSHHTMELCAAGLDPEGTRISS